MTAREAAAGLRPPPAPDAQRLITQDEPVDLAAHVRRYGPLPRSASALIAEVEASGLTGRGGAAFPAGRKLRAVAEASQRAGSGRGIGRSVIVANGSESEPASYKDAVLLSHSPHLVLDGIDLCAQAIGAARVYLCVSQRADAAVRILRQAVAEREQAGLDAAQVQITGVADGYLAGQETALISALNGGDPVPTFVPPRPADKGAHRRPTLVLNVETLAHIALIARYGAQWFRAAGTATAPGTALVTVTGAVSRPGVREIPLGTPLREVLARCGPGEPAQAVLTGGYFGTWLPVPAALGVPVSDDGLRAAGAALGPGVLAVLPESACGLAETARITGYLAGQAAGQCGPCRNGMPAIAEAMNWVAFGQPGADVIGWIRQLTGLVTGRGACHLPDGAAALVTSALSVFAADLRAHAASGPCAGASKPAVMPIPAGGSR